MKLASHISLPTENKKRTWKFFGESAAPERDSSDRNGYSVLEIRGSQVTKTCLPLQLLLPTSEINPNSQKASDSDEEKVENQAEKTFEKETRLCQLSVYVCVTVKTDQLAESAGSR